MSTTNYGLNLAMLMNHAPCDLYSIQLRPEVGTIHHGYGTLLV